ncbi:unnamed protein product [Caenorhabditis angaria]|uniref:Uncharacterized protein n=1 Tax=Caenorhabditis angaria TaxID=860376 RepID=A0A9P1N6V2_9PELO|nr:unnamed protein product [Caenorhabditis angaria]
MDLELPSFSENSPGLEKSKSGKILASTSKKLLKKAPETCAICLGKATGHHYDVASCNGCKSFFRRVTIEKLHYTCKFVDKCFENLTPGDPPPKCRSCRFKKCVEAGMNNLGIHSELKQELEKEKEKEKEKELPVVKIEKPFQTVESQVGDLIDKMIRLDVQTVKFRDCAFNPNKYPTLKECIKQENSILTVADTYGPMPGWPLNKEIVEEQFKKPPGQRHNPIMKRWLVYELLTQIEISKALPFFAILSEADRYHLMQDTTLMGANLTKSFYSFEQKSDSLLRPDGVRWFDLPFPLGNHPLRVDIGMRCLNAILRVGIDRVEFVLLRALVLSNPAVPEISEDARNILTRERQKYNIALLRYVLAKHGVNGPARFANILGFVDILEHQQKAQRDLGVLINIARPNRCKIPILDEIMKNV